LINSLRDYIEIMKVKDRVLEIKDPVSREDIPELIEKLSDIKKILLFEHIDGYDCRLVANCIPSLDVFSVLMGGV